MITYCRLTYCRLTSASDHHAPNPLPRIARLAIHRPRVVLPLLIAWLFWSSAAVCLAGNLAVGTSTTKSMPSSSADSHCDHDDRFEQPNCCEATDDVLPVVQSYGDFDPVLLGTYPSQPHDRDTLVPAVVMAVDIPPPDPISSIYLRKCSFLI